MARILAVDFGEQRIGLATSDASGSLATPRRTVLRKADGDAAERIRRFCEEEEVELVVFGIPRSPDGVESPFAARIRSFAGKFAAAVGLPVVFHEETLTSDEAARRAGGASLDAVAAAVLLEDFLAHRAEAGKARP
ncbi:MAG: Holliday junction resolvase RuvX [Thermoanaerobaculia bacterium]